MFTFLLVVHALIAASLVAVILMQRSEGGGLGMGSGPSGLMTARGAADFLTRATGVLAALFIGMSLLMAALASFRDRGGTIDTSLAQQPAAKAITAPVAPSTPTSGIPMMGGPAPAAPDSLTAGALAPASGGPPAPVKAQTEAPPKPRTIPASALKTIDTKAIPSGNVGINGVPAATPAAPASGNSQH